MPLFAVDDRVESHLGILHLEILEQLGVLDAAHERDCRPLVVTGQPFKIVVEHPVAFADDPYAARVGRAVPEKVVSVDCAAVAVPEGQRAFAAVEHIVAVGIRTRFVRDDFDLPVTSEEIVVADFATPFGHRNGACADTDHLLTVDCRTVFLKRERMGEVITADAVVGNDLRIDPYDQKRAEDLFIDKRTAGHLVIVAIDRYPLYVLVLIFGKSRAAEDTVVEARTDSVFFRRGPEVEYCVAGNDIAVLEIEP